MQEIATMYDWYNPNVDIEMMILKAVVLPKFNSDNSITSKVARLRGSHD